MEFKKATVGDCGFIASLFDNDEYELYFAENDTTEAEWAERFEYLADYEKLIIYENGEPVGWLTYKLEGDICDIGIIVIKHELMRSGIGYRAFDKAISSLPPTVKQVKLDVQKRNAHAVAFYKRYGFAVAGEERQPVGDGEQPYLNMVLQREPHSAD